MRPDIEYTIYVYGKNKKEIPKKDSTKKYIYKLIVVCIKDNGMGCDGCHFQLRCLLDVDM